MFPYFLDTILVTDVGNTPEVATWSIAFEHVLVNILEVQDCLV